MAIKNPRVLVTLEPVLYNWLKSQAQKYKISMSLLLRDLVKKEFQQENWFWAKDWQAGEKEADADIKKRRYREFDSVEELIKDLKA